MAVPGLRVGVLTSAITNYIRAIVRGSEMTAYELNHGQCEEIAESIEWKFPGAVVRRTGIWDTSLPTHAWAEYDRRHYDAEAPESVEDLYDLPIFRRST